MKFSLKTWALFTMIVFLVASTWSGGWKGFSAAVTGIALGIFFGSVTMLMFVYIRPSECGNFLRWLFLIQSFIGYGHSFVFIRLFGLEVRFCI